MSDLTPPDLYYQHSGRPGWAIPLTIFIGIPVTISLAAIYAYVVVYCPVIGYVNLLFLGALIFCGGFLLDRIARVGKCRNPAVMTGMGLLLGCIALYASWLFFLGALLDDVSLLALITNPVGMWNIIGWFNANGWWGPAGLIQWAIVATEAVAIVGGFTLAGRSAIGEDIFCEPCDAWCEPFETMLLKKDPTLPADQRPRDNLQILAQPETNNDDFPRYEADVLQCESCQSMQAIRVYDVVKTVDGDEVKIERELRPGVLVQRS